MLACISNFPMESKGYFADHEFFDLGKLKIHELLSFMHRAFSINMWKFNINFANKTYTCKIWKLLHIAKITVYMVIDFTNSPTIILILLVSLPMGLLAVQKYVPLSTVVTLSRKYSARKTAVLLLWINVTTLVLVVCINETLSLYQMNVSGGDPCDIQDIVKEEPYSTVIFDDSIGSIIGATVCNLKNIYHVKLLLNYVLRCL